MEGGPMRLLITIWYILESQNHIHKTKAFSLVVIEIPVNVQELRQNLDNLDER